MQKQPEVKKGLCRVLESVNVDEHDRKRIMGISTG